MSTPVDHDLQAQRQYVERIESEGFDYSVTVADAFIRGIRDLGYRDTARAIDEQIDNSIQAGADDISIIFGFHGGSDTKPSDIVVADDGHGMDPAMLRLSVIWGGTHREGDRQGFGRYGWGLPSSSVSMGRRFTVYSRVTGEPMHAIAVDLDEIAEGAHTHDHKIRMPLPERADLPEWLAEAVGKAFDAGLEHGTVVHASKLDRLSWKTTSGLERHLLQHLGLTYRNFLRDVMVTVNGKRVEPIDPLFITPGYRFYDLDSDRAEPLPPLEFEVKDPETRKPVGTVKVRFSYMPPTFARIDKDASPRTPKNNNGRLAIMSENNGLIILREGRQIDVISRGPWLSINNDDRYWGVEIDMPATLDEEMSITTSKQQIVLSDRMWELLKQNGVLNAIREMRKRYDVDVAKAKARRGDTEEEQTHRASEQAMMDSEKFTTRKPIETQRKKERSRKALDDAVKRLVSETGAPRERIEQQILSDASENPFRVRHEALPGAPFYRVQQIGGQKLLFLNTEHRFFIDVYAGHGSTPRMRAALEVVLFAIGATELDANDERQQFYELERGAWSERLTAALHALETIDSSRDARLRETDTQERKDSGEAA